MNLECERDELTATATQPRITPANAALAALTAGTMVLAGGLLARGGTTWLEAISFVTGAICVWLTVRESVWNFPIGLANELTFLMVFAQARLYADAGLQLVYFALTAIGWYLWLYGGVGQTTLRISWASSARCWRVAGAGIVLCLALYLLLRRVGDAAPLVDVITTSLSLCAQWLLDRKNLQNWLIWMAADVIYVPLYLSRGLYLTAILYAVFLCMCLIGWQQWQRTWQAQQEQA